MFPFQDRIAAFPATVLAGMAKLFQQVFPDLISEQGTVLIFFPFYIGIFQQLGIKTDSFQGTVRYRLSL